MKEFKSLVELLETTKKSDNGLTVINSKKDEQFLSYKSIYTTSRSALYNLQETGFEPRSEVILFLENLDSYIYYFWASILGNMIPVPLTAGTHESIVKKMIKIVNDLSNATLIISDKIHQKLNKHFQSQYQNLKIPIYIDEFHSGNTTFKKIENEGKSIQPDANETALIQFSSGSNGDPKGVILSHKNILTNVNSIIKHLKINENDRQLNWMPLTHDMGLILGHITPMAASCSQFQIPINTFIRRPSLWIEKCSSKKISITSSPNFGFKYYLKNCKYKNQISKIDLSNLRLLLNGAEPISKTVCNHFINTMIKCQFRPEAMTPVYGLAEASVGATGFDIELPYQSLSVNRNHLNIGDTILIEGEDSKTSMNIVNLGRPIPDVNIKISDNTKNKLPESTVGLICIKGDNVTKGYYNRPNITKEVISSNNWLDTGDIGFIRNKYLYFIGRKKEIITLYGQNFYPSDLEQIVEEQIKTSPGKIAITSVFSEKLGEEQVLVFLFYKKRNFDEFNTLSTLIKKIILKETGITISQVIPITKLPKTTSGKIQRYKLSDQYLKGKFNDIISQISKSNTKPKNTSVSNSRSREYVRETVCTIFEDIMGYKILEMNKNLAETGVDSLKALQFQNTFKKYFKISLPITFLFDHFTINAITDYIYTQSSSVQNTTVSNEHNPELIKDNRIAVIGIGCRIPGNVKNPDDFWSLLKNGYNAIIETPKHRWNNDDFYDSDPNKIGKMYSRKCGFLQEYRVEDFDANFFGISPREMKSIDPQQRLILETGWEALEYAGIAPLSLKGSLTGTFLGCGTNEYNILKILDKNAELFDTYSISSTSISSISGRLSHFLGLEGPSFVLDTACSSSMTAIHLACNSILNGECNLALAGGVNIILSPLTNIALSKARMLSPDDTCKTFDASANGYVRGEGAGVLVLKLFQDAIKDNDNILATICGTSVNHDGNAMGFSVPRGLAQQQVIKKALHKASLQPDDISYVESHGTGTSIGDPIEIEALGEVFNQGHSKSNRVVVGAVKPNIGHLEAASGVVSIIKVILSMQNDQIPGNIHLETINPKIDLNTIFVEFPTSLRLWPTGYKRKIAGVSSFGFSGTNSHVILEEQPRKQVMNTHEIDQLNILTISAKSKSALLDYALLIEKHLFNNTDIDFPDLCYTLNTGRSQFDHRLSIVSSNKYELHASLTKFNEKKASNVLCGMSGNRKEPKLLFIYCEKIVENFICEKYLYIRLNLFNQIIDQCSLILKDHFSEPFEKLLLKGNYKQGLESNIVCFVISYALTRMWQSWGVTPNAVSGIGIGKISALCASGCIDFKDAIELILRVSKNPEYDSENVVYSDYINSIKIRPQKYEIVDHSTCETFDCSSLSSIYVFLAEIPVEKSNVIPQIFNSFMVIGNGLYDTNNISDSKNKLISSITYKSIVESVANLYTKGIAINWKRFYSYDKFNKIPLPTYPFQRDRHWQNISISDNSKFHTPKLTEFQAFDDTFDRLIYDLNWIEIPHSKSSESTTLPTIIFADDKGVGNQVAQSLTQHGHTCLLIKKGTQYVRSNNNCFTINPVEISHFRQLFKDITHNMDNSDVNIYHFWSVDTPPLDKLNYHNISQEQEKLHANVFHIIHTVQMFSSSHNFRIWMITNGAQSLHINDQPNGVMQATVWGLLRSLLLELPGCFGGLIDIDPQNSTRALTSLLLSPRSIKEMQVLIRNNKYYAPRLLRSKMKLSLIEEFSCKSQYSYLITGGTGGLGLETALWLAHKGAGQIILTSRSGFPNKSEWDTLSPQSNNFKKLHILKKIERLGSVVSIIKADVNNSNQMKSVFETIARSNYPLRGILHTASNFANIPIAEMDHKTFYYYQKEKVLGAIILHNLSKDLILDFFVLFSSVSSLWGMPNQSFYTSGNCFMDSLAHYRQVKGLKGLSVNWGSWAETGILAKLGGLEQYAEIGHHPIYTAPALTILGSLIQSGISQQMIADIEWKRLKPFFETKDNFTLFSLIDDGKIGRKDPEEPEKEDEFRQEYLENITRYSEETNQKELLVKIVNKVIINELELSSTNQIDQKQPFMEMGVDSYLSVVITDRLNRIISPEKAILSVSTLFNYTTIDELAKFIFDETTSSKLNNKNGVDNSDYTYLLEEVKALSDEEIDISSCKSP